jgi:hypothetical protein
MNESAPQSELFTTDDLATIQPTGSPWQVSNDNPATVPVPLQVSIVKVDGPYTERDRKLWVFLLHAVFEELGEKPIHTLSVREINAIFRELGGEHDYKWIWEAAKRLSKTTAEWQYTLGDERFDGISAIFSAEVGRNARRSGSLKFAFPPLLIPIIKEPMRFARLRVHFLLKLSGKYAVTLYEILEGFANRRDGRCEVSIDDLRMWLKVPEGSYKIWKDFRKRVLDPAMKQINEDPIGAGFSVEYTPVKEGKFYRKIIFQLTKTDNRKTTEKLIKAKTKARKDTKAGAKIVIEPWALERCKQIAIDKGWDFATLEREFRAFANNPDNASAAFVGFCQKKEALR